MPMPLFPWPGDAAKKQVDLVAKTGRQEHVSGYGCPSMNTPIHSTVPILPRCFFRASVAVVCLAAFFTGMARVSAQVVVYSNNFNSLAGFAGNTITNGSNWVNVTNGYAQFTAPLGTGGTAVLQQFNIPGVTNVQSTGFTVSWDLRFPTTNSVQPIFPMFGSQAANLDRAYGYKVEPRNGTLVLRREYQGTNGGWVAGTIIGSVNTTWASAANSNPFDTIQFTFTPNFTNGNHARITVTQNLTNTLLTYIDNEAWRMGTYGYWATELGQTVGFRVGGEIDNLVVTIPEPSTVALLLLGAGAVLLRHRYLRRRASGAFPTEGPRH
jgi:hypothetical protein